MGLELLQEIKPAWAFRIKGTSSAALDPAFASQVIQVHRVLGWNMDRVNVHGGRPVLRDNTLTYLCPARRIASTWSESTTTWATWLNVGARAAEGKSCAQSIELVS